MLGRWMATFASPLKSQLHCIEAQSIGVLAAAAAELHKLLQQCQTGAQQIIYCISVAVLLNDLHAL